MSSHPIKGASPFNLPPDLSSNAPSRTPEETKTEDVAQPRIQALHIIPMVNGKPASDITKLIPVDFPTIRDAERAMSELSALLSRKTEPSTRVRSTVQHFPDGTISVEQKWNRDDEPPPMPNHGNILDEPLVYEEEDDIVRITRFEDPDKKST